MIENEEYTPVTNEPEISEGETIESEAADVAPVREEDPCQPVKNKGGRKPIDEKGETRSEKLMLYLTPSMIADVRDWCRIKGISYANFIVGLIGDFMKDKQERLEFFRKFSDES